MKTVLVLDANQRSALATTRSLGGHGVTVFTADDTRSALAGSSRYSHKYFQHPAPLSKPEEFITSIRSIATVHIIDIILPMTELTTALLLQHREELPDVILTCPNLETIDALANKCSLMRLAESLDIPIPPTWYVDNPDDLSVALADLPYPLVLKPAKSWLINNGTWLHTSVRFADNPTQAQEIIDTDPAFSHPYMFQAHVEGTGQGVFALYHQGEALASFNHRRLREKPPWGGVSVLSESVPIDPTLLTHARALLDAVKWHGIAMVEFKVNEDGTPYLMEINTRFWGSLQLAIDAGVDFPWLLYQMACGKSVEAIHNYKTGTRLRWLLGDLDSLYISLKRNENSLMEKLAVLLRFLTPHPFTTRHEVNRWSDIRPFLWELKHYLK
ncbi:ATP-grasp enzyme-like protein [hydrothermal vent metagenome]|uniref:ATP-grasp enzyme-like protein n=1 Tax=hydrothermal vent metagenome TaxID=652676 RepID=A0A3B0YBJ4_9ZZZZ